MPLDGPRKWHVGKGWCVLCYMNNVPVFYFDDNESWSEESICSACLWEALRLVNQSIFNQEQKRNDN